MDKFFVKPLLFIFILSINIIACENLVTDLPGTNFNAYISGNIVTFPQGTKAIDVYNTLLYLFPNQGQYYSVTNGNLEYNRSTINNLKVNDIHNTNGIDENPNGLLNGIRENRTIDGIKHIHLNYGPEINEHIVYLYLPSDNITLVDSSTRPILYSEMKLIFKWQRQTTNIWQNDEIGKTSYNMKVEMINNGTSYDLTIETTPVKISFEK